ncbi:MAG: transposase [Candidatus Hadarchaeum sp.]
MKGGKATMRDETREKILREAGEQIKAMVKELLERLMREERALYLAEHPTKANGYYTRNPLTLTGHLEDLKVPRVRDEEFHPRIFPYRRRTSLELSEAILALYAAE